MASEKERELECMAPNDNKGKGRSENKPVLYKTQAFSAYKGEKFEFSTKITQELTGPITAENTKPLIQAEKKKASRVEDTIQSSYQAVAKQRSRKKRWLSFGFLMLNLIVLAVILFFQIRNEGAVSFSDLLASKMNWWWAIIGVLLFLLINAIDSMRIAVLIKKVSGHWRPILSYKSTVTCRFYDCITPLSTGGQPFQIYYLSKRGLNGSTASSVPLSKYVYGQMVFVVYTAIILLCSIFMKMDIHPLLITMAWIGLVLNAALIMSVLLLSISKKWAPRLVIGVLKLGAKLRMVKDYQATFKKLMRTVKDYTATFRMFMKSGWNALIQIVLSVLYLTAIYTIPFVIYCMFSSEATLQIWFELLVLQVVCDLAISFIPLPGGAGTAELSFGALFSEYFKKSGAGITVWAMLFWRILTYYGYLLQGVLLLFYDFLFGNKKIAPLLAKYKAEDRAKVADINYMGKKMPQQKEKNEGGK